MERVKGVEFPHANQLIYLTYAGKKEIQYGPHSDTRS